MIRIQLFGTPSLLAATGPLAGRAAQSRPLALLALLASEHPRPVGRDRLIAHLLPEEPTDAARHRLRDALYVLRAALGEDALVAAGDDLRLNPQRVQCDLWDFDDALHGARHDAALRVYAGPFMDGFHLPGSVEFERWLAEERARFARKHAQALEAVAQKRAAAGDLVGAVGAWQERVALDPYDSRLALRLMEALHAAGNRIGALRHAARHATLLREEFGAEPDPQVEALAERLRNDRAAHAGAPAAAASAGRGASEAPAPAASAAERVEVAAAVPASSSSSATEGQAGQSRQPDAEEPAAGRSPRAVVSTRRTRWLVAAALLATALVVGGLRAFWPRAAEPDRSIVTLPFLNLSPTEDGDYFSDGLTEEIITRLSAVPELKVISRTSAMHYKGSGKPLRQIADELKVAHVLEGSVRQGDGRIRISAQLIDARTDVHLWARNYDYALDDVLRVQEQIAEEVVRALHVELSERGRLQLARRGTLDPEAYRLYRRGRFLWNLRTREAHEQAVDYYSRALQRDSSYADAYAGLADAYLTAYQLGLTSRPEEETYSRLKWAAERALALDDASADAHTSFAVALWWQRNWPGAERELRRALELNPGHATARSWYGLLLAGQDRLKEALRETRRAYEVDPFGLIISGNYGWICRVARDYDCAIEQYRRTLEIKEDWAPAYAGLAIAYAEVGMHREAIRNADRAVELSLDNPGWHAIRAYALARAGQAAAARASLQRAKQQTWEPFQIARVHVALGEPDSAFAWLERSSWRWPHRAARADPALDPLRSDARFARLVERVDREMGLR